MFFTDMMQVIPIYSEIFLPPQDDLFSKLAKSIQSVKEGDILCITSKVVSIHQGRSIWIDPHWSIEEKKIFKDRLIEQEATRIWQDTRPEFGFTLTLTHNTLIPSAGIDESNSNGYFLLWPTQPYEMAQEIWKWIRHQYQIKNVGIILTDSHCIPCRLGVVGVSLSYWGLEGLRDYRGKPDIFGRELAYTRTNVVEPLASLAVMAMGEADECTPFVILRDIPHIQFSEISEELNIPLEDDLFYPVFS